MSDPIINPNLEWDETDQVFKGKFIVGQDNDIVFKVKRDKTIDEGNETLSISIQNIDENDIDSITGKSVDSNSVKEKSVDIVDSSKQLIFNLSIVPSGALSSGLNEPEVFSVLLQVDNFEEGFDSSTIPYVIETAPSGGTIDASDFSLLPGNSLSGNFELDQYGFGSVNLEVSGDYKTEGDEVFRFKLVNNPEVYIDVKIWDTSLTPHFTLDPNLTTINEGQILEIDLITQNLGPNATVPFTISGTGITTNDLSNSNKTLTLVGGDIKGSFFTDFAGNDTFTVTISEDALTESNEIMNFSLDNGKDDVDITIVSTSNTPLYSQVWCPSTVTEGSSLTCYLNGQNMLSGVTSAQWNILNISSQDSDFVSTSGNFNIDSSNTSQPFSIQIADDINYEVSPSETFMVRVTVDGQQFTSHSVTIDDSADEFLITGLSGPDEVYEGMNYTYNVTGQNMTTGPRYLRWVIQESADINPADAEIPEDFDSIHPSLSPISGTSYVWYSTANGFTIKIKDDLIHEPSDEIFRLFVWLAYSPTTGFNDAYWGEVKTVRIKPSD